VTRLDVFHAHVWVLLIAFLVTLGMTPVMRRLAIANGVVDRPNEARKIHKMPIAYMGGVAVFLGVVAGILWSYFAHYAPEALGGEGSGADMMALHAPVPLSILAGMTVIAVVGLIDDVVGTTPRVKIGGQLFAAAALAATDVGVKVGAGVMIPLAELFGFEPEMVNSVKTLAFNIPLPAAIGTIQHIHIDLIYWAGTAIIAFFVIGACNASNLVDGLDGLLSGVTAIATVGLLVIALTLAVLEDGPRDTQRVVLCMAVLGACLGFLPHNFNPATIFLGDCGSLLLGFCTIVIILTLGDTGKTHLVLAGLVIYAIPLIDTTLAIIRRKMAGKKISDADSDHLHHMFKRALGVKGAAFALYGIGAAFAVLGVAMTLWKARVVYVLIVIAISYVGVIAIKVARKKQIEDAAAKFGGAGGGSADGTAASLPIAAATPSKDEPPISPAQPAATAVG
jgi:UDP-GlcNAc:undecaprenyl-phosphate/decaprenyl-phosphate GlcNAc-1-phosphate transferase